MRILFALFFLVYLTGCKTTSPDSVAEWTKSFESHGYTHVKYVGNCEPDGYGRFTTRFEAINRDGKPVKGTVTTDSCGGR